MQRQQLMPCSLKTVLPKPLSCLVLPDSPKFIASFKNFGAVLAIEAKLVGSPESGADCYSENEEYPSGGDRGPDTHCRVGR
jgi:hypothetical protein